MVVDVYDAQMEPLGVIEKMDTLIWTPRYWHCGGFSMLVPYTDKHARLLQKERLIMRHGGKQAAQIRYIHISKDGQGADKIEVKGTFSSHWIGKRVIVRPIVMTDRLQVIMERMVNENVINPANSLRKIPGILMAQNPNLGGGAVEYASEPFDNVLLAMEDCAQAAKLGFDMTTDIKARLHTFLLYKGRDLTSGQTENPPCIFSIEFDNVLEQEFTFSSENRKTSAYVGGEEKEGIARKVAEVGAAVSGLQREELYVNASSITQTYRVDNTEYTMSSAQYMDMLTQRGAQELEQHGETMSFESKIKPEANLRYKEDYDVGDVVTCFNRKWGVRINARITEISEVYQKNKRDIYVTFGDSLPALTNVLRRKR